MLQLTSIICISLIPVVPLDPLPRHGIISTHTGQPAQPITRMSWPLYTTSPETLQSHPGVDQAGRAADGVQDMVWHLLRHTRALARGAS